MIWIFLFFISLSFASWKFLVSSSLLIVVFVFALFYMVGRVFSIPGLIFDSKEELSQLILSLAIILLFTSSNILSSFITQHPFKDAEKVLNKTSSTLSSILNSLMAYSKELGHESGKSVFCSFGAVSFSVASCQGYSMLTGPISLGSQTVGVALAEMTTLKEILNLSKHVFSLFFPIGIFLRSFKFTRGAGSLLISFAFSVYVFLPLSIILVDDIISGFKVNSNLAFSVQKCDEYNFGGSNDDGAVSSFKSILGSLDYLLYYVFFKSTLLLVIVSMIFLGAIRGMNKIFKSEVDVSMLGRLI